MAEISEQVVLARTHPPRDRLADRSSPDDGDDVGHCALRV
jgi:hypothetical protein